MDIIHETSIGAALAIIEHGKFIPASTNKYNADSGLNCALTSKAYKKGQLEGYGATLLLEWRGSIKECSHTAAPPYQLNILLDQHPWRCFIPRDNDPNLLLLKDITFDLNLYKADFNKKPRFSLLKTEKQITSWVNMKIEDEIASIKGRLRATPIPITIV